MTDTTQPNTNDPVVTIYSTPSCAFCRTEKQWLDSLGVAYVSKDIEEDEHAKDELLEKLGGQFQGVPTTDIAGDIIVGFDRPKLQEALKKNGLIAS